MNQCRLGIVLPFVYQSITQRVHPLKFKIVSIQYAINPFLLFAY